ncbi:MAG: hypothetical protein RL199_683, partial [Pseudomonadota bacterium]
MRPVRFLFFSLLLAACSASPGEPRATEAAAISANASELTLIDCPWGSGQCAWPGAGDRSKALHVGGWTTGTGPTAKVTRTDLLAKFVMQGSGFVSEVRLAASRDGSQSGSLWVELRADDVKPEGGRILARGRTLVSNAPNGTLGELRVPLHTVAPVSRLADGTTYWLRIWVQPTSTKAPAALWLDTASIAPTGMALRSCATTGASWAATCPAYRVTPGALLAFLPALEALASPSCEDRVRNGDEAGRDCGK